jgi:hypothetical protein
MGLLRKAAAAAVPRDAVVEQAPEAPRAAEPVSGLLKKIITSRGEEKAAPADSEQGLGIELAAAEEPLLPADETPLEPPRIYPGLPHALAGHPRP